MEEDNAKAGEVITVSRGSRFSRLTNVRHRLSPKMRKYIYGTFAILLVGGAIAGWLLYFKGPALIIGSERISRDRYKVLVKQAEKSQVNEEGAKKTIVGSYKYQQVAKRLGIAIDKDKLAELDQLSALPTTEKTAFYELGLYKGYIDTQIELRKQEGYDGYVFYYPFSRNFLDSDPNPSNPLFKNAESIEKDRVAADKKVKDARTRLTQKKVSPQELIKEIEADSSLIYGNASNDSQHFVVNKAGFVLLNGAGSGRFVASRFMDILPGLAEGAVSPIRNDVQKYLETQTQQVVSNNTAYYFVYKEKNLTGDKDFAEKFKKELENIKVSDNVKN